MTLYYFLAWIFFTGMTAYHDRKETMAEATVFSIIALIFLASTLLSLLTSTP